MKDIKNYSLKDHNTFGIDARCKRFLEFEDDYEAVEVAEILRKSRQPYIIIGGGSNLLLTKDFDGIVVRSGIKGHYFEDDYFCERMTCGSGEVWDDMVAKSIEAGYYGMENLSLIPGDVGASAVQNIGAYGMEAKDLILCVWMIEISTGKPWMIGNEECEYGYRQSRFKKDWKDRFLITRVTYGLSKSFRPHLDYGNIRAELERKGITEPTAQQLRDTIIDIRNAKLPDPKVEGNAGSFFMNPIISKEQFEQIREKYPTIPSYPINDTCVKVPAGWLIEQVGWKGRSLGPAAVYDRQALVLVNLGGATGADILSLYNSIQSAVRMEFGIELQSEVNFIQK